MTTVLSTSFTIGILASKAPQLNRWYRLAIYALLMKGVSVARK